MVWQFEAAGRPPDDDGPAWNALKNVRRVVCRTFYRIPYARIFPYVVGDGRREYTGDVKYSSPL